VQGKKKWSEGGIGPGKTVKAPPVGGGEATPHFPKYLRRKRGCQGTPPKGCQSGKPKGQHSQLAKGMGGGPGRGFERRAFTFFSKKKREVGGVQR